MKNLVIIAVVAFGLMSCQESVKIAYVDVEEIMKEYKGTKDTEATMKVKSDKLKSELDSLIGNWQNKAKVYQDNAQKMSANARAEREQALMQEQQQINQRQQAIQQQVQAEGQESLESLSKEINDFVKTYAKEKGYNFVLGTTGSNGTVMYGEEKADITDDVLVQLNKSYKNKE
ncbi:OmpH family outer membrane protein [Aureibaculum sp. 2210JD6-5]|uniref:OmpH family outer membrane protein n=1 Tax=Aureibaculum sp. 2210JD6-5 TaxID=3103957 RepID=UPI002AAD4A60|nr:OmpH family outer membrane protein [Aureibaculum sp. 2210JD6-5]MDY7394685.1 OmpH family outer membrane protein [Aureibaculum sp. 2210JD6-5]